MSRLGSKRTPDALGLKGCPGASIHRIAEKGCSRKLSFLLCRFSEAAGTKRAGAIKNPKALTQPGGASSISGMRKPPYIVCTIFSAICDIHNIQYAKLTIAPLFA